MPVPEPVTSPVKEIVWSPVLVPLNVALLFTVKVFVLVPPAIENPVAKEVGVNPLIVLLVSGSLPDNVLSVPVVGKIKSVVPVVFKVMLEAFETVVPVVVNEAPVLISPPNVIVFPVLSTPVPPFAPKTIPVTLVAVPSKLAVIIPALKFPLAFLFTIVLFVFASVAALAAISAVRMVAELDPPTLFTVGKSAVPPRSFANLIFPFTMVVASGVEVLVILAFTKAVVAS